MRTEMKPPPDPAAARGLLGPGWRQYEARRLPDRVPARVAMRQDPAVLAFRNYLTLISSSEDGAAVAQAAFPQIAAAVELNSNPALIEKLKCIVLAEIPPAEMAERLLLTIAVVETWELLFFDVRPSLKARDWVWMHVIEPPFQAGDVTAAARLHLAFSGGPVVGRCLWDADCRLPLDDAERFLGMKVRMDLKLREAYEVPVLDSKHALEIMSLANDVRRIELDEKKLAQKALETGRQYELDVRRLDLFERRMKQAAAERRNRPPRRQTKQKATSNVSPLQRQAVADMAQLKKGLARLALEQRIANSPLSKLTWAESTARHAMPVSPAVPRAEDAVLAPANPQKTGFTAGKSAHGGFFGEAAALEAAGAIGARSAEMSLVEV